MSEATVPFPQVIVKVNGNPLADTVKDQLFEVSVESSLHLPAMCEARFYDGGLELIDGNTLALGAPLIIEAVPPDSDTGTQIFSGEIVALEPEFTEDFSARLTVRAYDKSHRLHRGAKSQVYLNKKDSDVVQQLAGNAGLSAQVDATSQVHEHIFQDNQTDMEFIYERAARLGYEVLVDNGKLYFRKPAGGSGMVTLEWGVELVSFRPRVSLAGQVDKVTVKGWDVQKKQAVVGQKTSSSSSPSINVGGWGGQVAKSKLAAAESTVVRRPVASQAEANTVAQAVLDSVNAGFVEAEGVAPGNPNILAGKKIKLTGLGTKFSGSYMVTAAEHIFSPDGTYQTRFRVEGARPMLVSDMVAGPNGHGSSERQPPQAYWGGVVPAVVTNIEDKEKDWYRVKLKFPWLDDKLESTWARVATIGAGPQRGIYWLPEVNDEVLVAFEHGDFNRPYVIGALWNGKDKPPEAISAGVAQGKVKTRTIKTRLGHIIRLTDDDNAPTIEIIDAKEGTTITLNGKEKTLTITCKGDIAINADGNITMKSKKNITIEATQNVTIKGNNVTADAKANFKAAGKAGATMESNAKATVKGSLLEASATGKADFKAGAILTIQGVMVKIN